MKNIKTTALSNGKIKMMAKLDEGNAYLICICKKSDKGRYLPVLLESVKKMPVGVAAPTGVDSSLNGDAVKVESATDSNPSCSFPTMSAVRKRGKRGYTSTARAYLGMKGGVA